MWSLARITILGSCVAAGVATAVALAGHFASMPKNARTRATQPALSGQQPPVASLHHARPTPEAIRKKQTLSSESSAARTDIKSYPTAEPDRTSTNSQSPFSDRQAASQEAPPREPAAQLPAEIPLARQNQPGPNQQAVFPPAPYYMHYPDPVSDKIERLEKALQRVTEASTQSQIKRLEEQLAELSKSRQVSAPVETAPVQAEAVAPNETATAQAEIVPAQVETLSAQDVQTTAIAEPPKPKPATGEIPAAQADAAESDLAAIRRGEGDGRLKLNLRGQDLRELLEFLSDEAGLNILASENVTGTVTASLSGMDAESAIRAILRIKGFVAKRDGNFLYVGTPADLQQMERLTETIKTRVYRTDYVTAAEIQALVTPMLSKTGKVTVSSPAQTTIPVDTVKTGGDDFAGNEVIMVQDYEYILRRIDDLVAQVDQQPRQVMIESMIVSVGLDDSHSMGINFEAFRQKNNLRLVSGTPMATLGQIDVSKGGLQFGVLDGNVGAFINALEGIGDTDVIAAPHLLCLNKQKAEILIGDQKGYLSTTQTQTATTQTVQFLDIGTQLRIRPFISSDGMVRLEVHPELSTGEVKLVGQFALPEKSTTQVTTNIMCRDGCTVVIGGLIREDHARTVTQAAIIGNLPILGQLFRNKKVENQRSEIIVLLTPKIVHDSTACDNGARCRAAVSQRRAAVASRKISPVARYHYGRRYYRMAQSAWYAGNIPEAQRYLDIALRMNPRDIMARRLLGIMMSGEGEAVPHVQELPELNNGQGDTERRDLEPLEPEPLPAIEPTSLEIPPRLIPPHPPSRQTPRGEAVRGTSARNTSAVRPASLETMVPVTPQPVGMPVPDTAVKRADWQQMDRFPEKAP